VHCYPPQGNTWCCHHPARKDAEGSSDAKICIKWFWSNPCSILDACERRATGLTTSDQPFLLDHATHHAQAQRTHRHNSQRTGKKVRVKEDNPFKLSFFGAGVVVSAKHISSAPNGESSSTVELQLVELLLQSWFGGAGALPNTPLVDLEFLELRCLAGKNGVELFCWIWSCVELSQTRPYDHYHNICLICTCMSTPPVW
jgi:hypothetical protein